MLIHVFYLNDKILLISKLYNKKYKRSNKRGKKQRPTKGAMNTPTQGYKDKQHPNTTTHVTKIIAAKQKLHATSKTKPPATEPRTRGNANTCSKIHVIDTSNSNYIFNSITFNF
jgi:hypothetical protein